MSPLIEEKTMGNKIYYKVLENKWSQDRRSMGLVRKVRSQLGNNFISETSEP